MRLIKRVGALLNHFHTLIKLQGFIEKVFHSQGLGQIAVITITMIGQHDDIRRIERVAFLLGVANYIEAGAGSQFYIYHYHVVLAGVKQPYRFLAGCRNVFNG